MQAAGEPQGRSFWGCWRVGGVGESSEPVPGDAEEGVASSQGGILAEGDSWWLRVPPLGGPATSEEGSRGTAGLEGCKPVGLKAPAVSEHRQSRPWLRPRPLLCPFFPVMARLFQEEKQQKVVLPEPCGFLPSRRLNRSLGVCSFGLLSFCSEPTLRAGLSGPGCRAGCPPHSCGPDMGTSQGAVPPWTVTWPPTGDVEVTGSLRQGSGGQVTAQEGPWEARGSCGLLREVGPWGWASQDSRVLRVAGEQEETVKAQVCRT